MPTSDVQFWIVTAVCGLAAAFGCWRVVRGARRAMGKRRERPVSLTIEGSGERE
jgi:hypothetical protein